MIKFKFYFTRHIIGVAVLLQVVMGGVFAQSKAHENSRFAIIDPTYNSSAIFPVSNINEKATPWIYGASELECWRLQILQQRKDSAKLNVGYPGVFHKTSTDCSFRLQLDNPTNVSEIRFRVVGQGKLYVNDVVVDSFAEINSFQTINLKKNTKIRSIQFDIIAQNEPPALLIESKDLATSLQNWEWKSKSSRWELAYRFLQNNQKLPPHQLEYPLIVIKPTSVKNNLYDFNRELFGFIVIRSLEKPVINVGESEKEALDILNKSQEQSLELINSSDGVWKTKSALAFRYLYVEERQIADISCEAIFHPSAYKGAFACSDSTLTRIWMNSAYTLRLCMHDFLLDGEKRDRLPWAGDLSMSLLVDAYTFSEPELVRRSLVALGREGIKEKDINGIIDYSLWWIISPDQYQLYFADSLHLAHEWSRIKVTLKDLSSRCDSNGFLDQGIMIGCSLTGFSRKMDGAPSFMVVGSTKWCKACPESWR